MEIPKQIQMYLDGFLNSVSPSTKLKLFGLTQVPFIFLANPKVESLNDDECMMRLPYNRLTKNHLNSVYFGSQAIGADACVGIMALHVAKAFVGYNVVPVFKSFKADFIKRAEGDMLFRCSEGAKIRQMVGTAVGEKRRVTEMIHVDATTPDINNNELVSKFVLELSIKATEKINR